MVHPDFSNILRVIDQQAAQPGVPVAGHDRVPIVRRDQNGMPSPTLKQRDNNPLAGRPGALDELAYDGMGDIWLVPQDDHHGICLQRHGFQTVAD